MRKVDKECFNPACSNLLQGKQSKYCSRKCWRLTYHRKRAQCKTCGSSVIDNNPSTGELYSLCKTCREKQKKYQSSKKEQKKEYDKEYYKHNKKKYLKYAVEWRKNNLDRANLIATKSRLGLTQDEIEKYALDREIQKGKCKICNVKTKLHCDHDHVTGKYRGAICNKCNVAIAFMNDDIGVLKAAIQYLERDKLCE